VPATPALLMAGAQAQQEVALWMLLISGAVAASLAADTLWYLAGTHFGSALVDRLRRIVGTDEQQMDRVQSMIARWGAGGLILAKFIPGAALIAPPFAGMVRVRLAVFLLCDGIAGLLWAGLPMLLGAHFSEAVTGVTERIATNGVGAGTLLVSALLALVIARWTYRRVTQ